MNVKRIAIPAAVLMILLAVWAGTAEDAWICGKCGSENTGNFCVSCGQPKVSPTPLPTAEPTPEPTPEPEIWLCRHCRADNAFSNAFCRACGSPRPKADAEVFKNPLGELYKGMTERDVIEACGGTLPDKVTLDGHDLYTDFTYDSYGGLERVDLSINNSYITHRAFFQLIKDTFGAEGWSAEWRLDFGGGMSTVQSQKEFDGVTVSVWYVNDFMNMLRIEPHIDWGNVAMGRETVRAERMKGPGNVEYPLSLTGYSDIGALFMTGRAPVKDTDGKWGFIDSRGRLVIDCRYDAVSDFWHGYATVTVREGGVSKKGCLDPEGRVVIPVGKYEDVGTFAEGLCWVMEDGKWGCVDTGGNTVIPPVYDQAYYFREGLAAVKLDDKWGVIDRNGGMVIEPQFSQGFVFSDGAAHLQQNKNHYFIDKTGESLFSKDLPYAKDFSEGYAACVESLDKDEDGNFDFRVIDKSGNVVFTLKATMMGTYQEGLIWFARGGLVGFADTEGHEVIVPAYQDCYFYGSGFYHGYVSAAMDGKWGIIDAAGREVIPFEYDKMYPFHDGYAIGLKDGQVVIFEEPGGAADTH